MKRPWKRLKKTYNVAKNQHRESSFQQTRIRGHSTPTLVKIHNISWFRAKHIGSLGYPVSLSHIFYSRFNITKWNYLTLVFSKGFLIIKIKFYLERMRSVCPLGQCRLHWNKGRRHYTSKLKPYYIIICTSYICKD